MIADFKIRQINQKYYEIMLTTLAQKMAKFEL